MKCFHIEQQIKRMVLDIVAESFWGRDRQPAFFDVRVFNPLAQSYRNTCLSQCYHRNELEKRRTNQRSRARVFLFLCFFNCRWYGCHCQLVYKRIASLIADKHGKPYSKTINWMRCRLSFSLLQSAIMCLRGARSSLHRPICSFEGEIDLALAEGQVSS